MYCRWRSDRTETARGDAVDAVLRDASASSRRQRATALSDALDASPAGRSFTLEAGLGLTVRAHPNAEPSCSHADPWGTKGLGRSQRSAERTSFHRFPYSVNT